MTTVNPYEPSKSSFHGGQGETRASHFAWMTIGMALLTTCFVAWTLLMRTTKSEPILLTLVLLVFILGAYPTLAGIAWLTRSQPAVAIVVFLLSLLVFVGGGSMFAYDLYLYKTNPDHRRTMNWTIFLVPLAQWFFAFCVGAGVAIHWLATHRSRETQ